MPSDRILSCETRRQDYCVRARLLDIFARTFQGFLQRFDEHIELIGLQGLGHILHGDCLTLGIRRILVCSVDERKVFDAIDAELVLRRAYVQDECERRARHRRSCFFRNRCWLVQLEEVGARGCRRQAHGQ